MLALGASSAGLGTDVGMKQTPLYHFYVKTQ